MNHTYQYGQAKIVSFQLTGSSHSIIALGVIYCLSCEEQPLSHYNKHLKFEGNDYENKLVDTVTYSLSLKDCPEIEELLFVKDHLYINRPLGASGCARVIYKIRTKHSGLPSLKKSVGTLYLG